MARQLDADTILVCDTQGALSLGGVMGGLESEVSATTTNVLLEGAAWECVDIRKTVKRQNLPSEAAYRFSRGVHPAMTERGVRRGAALSTCASGRAARWPRGWWMRTCTPPQPWWSTCR